MKFSIIVPIFRVEQFLADCIISVLHQSFTDFELLLIDDGSDDFCPNICDSFASKDERIIVVHKKNEGLVSSRIKGATIAKGDYIINIDGDDFVDSDYLFKMSNIIDEFHPDMIVNGFSFHDEKTGKTTPFINQSGNGLFNSDSIKSGLFYDSSKPGTNNGTISLSAWSKVVKKELYLPSQCKVNKKISKGEDSLLTALLLTSCKSVYVSDYCGYHYRINEKSMMKTKTDNDFVELMFFLDELLKINKELNISDNQVFVCVYHRLYNLIDFYCSLLTRKQFIKSIRCVPKKLFDDVKKIRISHPSFKDRIRLHLIKKKRWNSYWLLRKI